MFAGLKMDKRSWITWLIIILLTTYQIVRLIVFASVYGGSQEDSGRFSSISRSLAKQGTYTTMVSTIVDPTVPGDYYEPGRFDVQDEEGRIWFWTAAGVGPGSIVPNAIILKLFGTSFWSLKIATFIFLGLFLLLTSSFLYYAGGIVSVLLFNLLLVFYPHLLVPLGHEPYGEMATIVYILVAYFVFLKATQASSHRTIYFFLCGFVCGLILITKLIGLFSLLSIFTLWFFLYIWQRYQSNEVTDKRLTLEHLLAMALGPLILPILWEVVKLITVVRVADYDTYKLFAMSRLNFIQGDSITDGANTMGAGFSELILAKLLIVSQISHPNSILSAIMFILIGVSGSWLAYQHRKEAAVRNMILLIWLGWLIHSGWFIFMSKRAKVRQDWFALILGLILFCWLISSFWQQVKNRPEIKTIAIASVLTVILAINLFGQRHAVGLFIPDSLVETWRLNHLAEDTLIGKYEQHMPWILFPRSQQEEAIDYLTQLPSTNHIYYVGNVYVSELPVLVGRVFYPLQRRLLMPHSDGDVVVISQSFSPWRRPQSLVEPIKQEIKRKCPEVLLENDYYIICSVTE